MLLPVCKRDGETRMVDDVIQLSGERDAEGGKKARRLPSRGGQDHAIKLRGWSTGDRDAVPMSRRLDGCHAVPVLHGRSQSGCECVGDVRHAGDETAEPFLKLLLRDRRDAEEGGGPTFRERIEVPARPDERPTRDLIDQPVGDTKLRGELLKLGLGREEPVRSPLSTMKPSRRSVTMTPPAWMLTLEHDRFGATTFHFPSRRESADTGLTMAMRVTLTQRSCTTATTAWRASIGVSGRTPWPRLKMWPGRPPARVRTSRPALEHSRGREQQRGIEIALDRRVRGRSVATPTSSGDAPIDADDVPAGVAHAARGSRRCRCRNGSPGRPPPREPRAARATVGHDVVAVVARRRGSPPTSRRAARRAPRPSTWAREIAADHVGELLDQRVPGRRLGVHEALGHGELRAGPPSMG